MKANKCPICGSTDLQFVHYRIPGDDETLVLVKRIECKKCFATTAGLCLSIDQAIAHWNAPGPIAFYELEPVKEVEE